jgi:hypothetical protein
VRGWLCFVVLLGCGDNVDPSGPALQHADTLFLAAHEDDDMIFMQPELLQRLREGSSTTTIYVTTAGPDGRGDGILDAAKLAYGTVAGSQAWDCGLIQLTSIKAQHCRLRDRPVSLIDAGLPDGGIAGDRKDSLLHLIDGTVSHLWADTAGTVTSESIIELFATLIDVTAPARIETLELAGTHGRDNSSHMFVASIGLWAAARRGYKGPVTWHRGYNVGELEPTLEGEELADAREMLGYYEACADGCAACGTSCPSLLEAHEIWLQRQYSTDRVLEARGKLASGDACLGVSLTLGNCADAATFEMDPAGTLRVGDACVTSAATDELSLAPCTGAPEQYWVLDSEGAIWNGRPPRSAPDMAYDHVRCLTSQGALTCGANRQVQWSVVPAG